MAKVFGYVFLVLVILGGCAVGLEKVSSREDKPVIQATVGSQDNNESAGLQFCLDLVATKPGDVKFIEKYGWKIVCSQSGDSELDASGDLETLGYTNFQKKTIYLDATLVDASVIVHEAAHALDDIAFDVLIREKAAMDLGEQNWDDADSYWDTPSEVFAESRAGCLGYPVYVEFAVMTCETINSLIAKSDFAGEIKSLVVPAG